VQAEQSVVALQIVLAADRIQQGTMDGSMSTRVCLHTSAKWLHNDRRT
jgi:hypothetical protein